MSSVIQKGDHLQYPNLELEAQGGLVTVTTRYTRIARPHNFGHRGIVTEFSAGSRRRLIRKIARLKQSRCTFVTLTYPDDYPTPQIAKNHLRALFERFRRRFPQMSAVWRLEFQERGAPHFHLLCFNLPYLAFWELREMWREIIGLPSGHYARVRIELVRSWRGVMNYASKYLAKLPDGEEGSAFFSNGTYLHAGRYWGVFNAAHLPFGELVKAVIPQVTPVALTRIKQAWSKVWPLIDIDSPSGAVLLTDDAYSLYSHACFEALKDCLFFS